MVVMIWAAGLRGAVAYGLALNLPASGADTGSGIPAIESATLVVVLVTTLAFGGATGAPRLQLRALPGRCCVSCWQLHGAAWGWHRHCLHDVQSVTHASSGTLQGLAKAAAIQQTKWVCFSSYLPVAARADARKLQLPTSKQMSKVSDCKLSLCWQALCCDIWAWRVLMTETCWQRGSWPHSLGWAARRPCRCVLHPCHGLCGRT